MDKTYTIVSLVPSGETEFDFPIWKWKKKMPTKLYQYYLLKKLPIKKEEVFYMKELGHRIYLPFSMDEKKDNQVLINQFLKKLKHKEQLNHVFAEKELREYLDLPYIGSPWLLNFLMFPQIMEKVVYDYQIDCKNMKLVLLDSNDSRIEYVLELMLPYLNYLTIVTSRVVHFNDFVDYAFESTGLVVEVLNAPLEETIPGDFIISLGSAEKEDNLFYHKAYHYFDKKAVLLLLDADPTKLWHMYYRRKDLIIIYDTFITIYGDKVDRELAVELLCNKHWRLKAFAEHRGNLHYQQEVEELTRKYEMEIREINVL